ncbi:heavy metal translocating P-type ATPase [Solitalea sp. MAHUQ-68]|uniref:P-type Zn(2+) transporter n=1 Tax=Solitalea agri TaxID=2953739 RepID=A0A9X2F466_9SPHI|nr:heavy metal translocating P-type ATPase [Solitalea agri]MCO4293899.1 heavy metal translocating P-type ATPase [Solitalea agri]
MRTPYFHKGGHDECCSIESEQAKSENAAHKVHETSSSPFKEYIPSIASFVLLMLGLLMDHFVHPSFFNSYIRLAWYLVAYIPVAGPVIRKGFTLIAKGEVFTEFFLMGLATIGAFAIGQYPEGVAVMLFYTIGELFQGAAVSKAKGNIKALLDVRPDVANVLRNGSFISLKPERVNVDEPIQIKVGEKVPLDGIMLSDHASFNTSALTGESKPKTIHKNEQVLAGMLNLDRVIELKVNRKYSDSSLARILELVQNATAKKAKTELFIRKFAKIYTPIVVYLAIALTLLPYFFVEHYIFSEWLYRALIFLVISCPCALVISIPLGYFGGIGAASRNGILFKGSNYLDLIAKVETVVMDKTGTLTEGVFKVQKVHSNGYDEKEFIKMLGALESKSTHPIANAIVDYSKNGVEQLAITNVEEVAGLGLKGEWRGKKLLAGNSKLMDRFDVTYDSDLKEIAETTVMMAVDGKFAGYVLIADQLKPDAKEAIEKLQANGVRQTVMLSGDKTSITQKVADFLGIDQAFGDLLPEHKVEKFEEIKKGKPGVVAFVGDGINDAPVLALADIGIAMGGLGSDAAIETADVVIQTDQPSKIATAIRIGRATKAIVWQNIGLAFTVKAAVLILGAGGLATMWEAVFADVGVALLAVLNAVRIQRMKF